MAMTFIFIWDHWKSESYLLPRSIGDTGTPQLCLRDVDMDLTNVGKLSVSESSSWSDSGQSWNSFCSEFLIATKRSMASPPVEITVSSVWKSWWVLNSVEFCLDPLSGVNAGGTKGAETGAVKTGSRVSGGSLDPSCRSLKYSESLREEQRSKRSSSLLHSVKKFIWMQKKNPIDSWFITTKRSHDTWVIMWSLSKSHASVIHGLKEDAVNSLCDARATG